jgi:hypothetical protein
MFGIDRVNHCKLDAGSSNSYFFTGPNGNSTSIYLGKHCDNLLILAADALMIHCINTTLGMTAIYWIISYVRNRQVFCLYRFKLTKIFYMCIKVWFIRVNCFGLDRPHCIQYFLD